MATVNNNSNRRPVRKIQAELLDLQRTIRRQEHACFDNEIGEWDQAKAKELCEVYGVELTFEGERYSDAFSEYMSNYWMTGVDNAAKEIGCSNDELDKWLLDNIDEMPAYYPPVKYWDD